ncbi:hypothetical protein FW774_07120 [Pedobacter sp. BS3]|uniref:S41 family peptidase n=1 Tax=Pedobacter sp. BS3 TaxID=2567937 RepID=UPI0011EFCE7C|nr:S41 family peptidase [Pedobacter sp. BS3]TZF84746.1 hypothetical protein FW774_07120 [Pedobacter sp. BS3]
MKKNILRLLIPVLVLNLIVAGGCKKSKLSTSDGDNTDNTNIPGTGTRDQLTKDSIFLYAKEAYYWYASLPDYATFKPRNFSSNDAELYALTQYSNNPATGKPYEYVAGETYPKYSFFYTEESSGAVSALKADLNETATDYGFAVMYNTLTDLRVTYVYPGSPAALQGLTRGCRITAINGRSGSSISYDASPYGSGTNLSFVESAIFGTNATISITYINLSGQTKSVVISRSTYTLDPILYTTTYTIGDKKVGYLVFNSFTNNVTSRLKSIFSDFQSKGVTELVVDLRYNGGGYVNTAIDLINLIAPVSQNNNVMFTTYYNNNLQSLTTLAKRKASILVNQPLPDENGHLQNYTGGANGKYVTYADLNYSSTSSDNIERFSTSGSLAPSRVYFIVTGSTASASELTINSLKPVMDVKLIGETTYGKPVGFFPIHIDDFDMYIPEFETKNQVGTGGYYSGLTVDRSGYEDLDKAWGDSTEALLAYALGYTKNGVFSATKKVNNSVSSEGKARLSAEDHSQMERLLDRNRFKGMVATPVWK